ncbi:S8 family serine peptidase [Chitinophaga sp. CCNWLY40-1]|uniref:S8 family serine peptidase n=1 Tax=Chitinophaga sp. CCNWLY40-1 TaxID=3136720 RepID=UPI0030AE5E84
MATLNQNHLPVANAPMRIISSKIWPLLFLQLFLYYYTAAQQPHYPDSLVQRYATDTFSLQRKSGPFLVKFAKLPDESKLQQWGLIQPLSRYHYILQHAPEDSTLIYCYSAGYNFKASIPLLQQLEKIPGQDSIIMQVSCKPEEKLLMYARVQSYSTQYHVAIAKVKKQDWPLFISQPAIQFADLIRRPAPEIIINTGNLAVNRITFAQQQFPLITGKRVTVSVKEDLFDTTDIDLQGRYISSSYNSTLNTAHALIMATLIGGAGNSGAGGKGVAPEVKLSSADYNSSLFPDEDAYYQQSGITVQNHSYGTGIENYYGAEAVTYDQQIYATDTLVHVYSSGNVGTSPAAGGRYQGIVGYANLSGNFKQAKNIIVSGGTDGATQVMALSSKGPAYDGRILPHVTAYGEDGTSGAAALTSGVVALLQDTWRMLHNTPASAALIKAVVINSAFRSAGIRPSFGGGYGNLHAYGAIKTIQDNRLLQGNAGNHTVTSFDIAIPEGIQEVKVTLCWNDPPATVNAVKALINDLDITATTADGKTWLPWTLSTYPLIDSLLLPAKRGRDSINNTEQISIEHPVAGTMRLRVTGAQVAAGTQPFFLAYELVPAKSFQWQNPAAGATATAGQALPLQWQTTYSGNSELSFSSDSGHTWQPIAQNIPVENGLYNWVTPNIFRPVMLKLTLTDTSFISDPFYVSPVLTMRAGFNCTDTTLLYWNRQAGATAYQLYTMSNTALIPYSQVRDTFIFIPKATAASLYFAVSPVAAGGWTGIRSYAIDYTQQGVGCYVQNLLADPTTDNKVALSLTLGSTWQLQTVYWERLTREGWITLQQQPVGDAMNFNYLDNSAPEGLLRYRVKLLTVNGQYIYADPVTVTIIAGNHILLFPNPVSSQFTVLDGTPRSRKLVITDMSGRIVLQRNLEDIQETVEVQRLANGIYNCSIYADNKRIYSTQFVKQY